MGLAASQIRLLTLVKRKNDNELETMFVSNKKMALSRAQSELAQEYHSKLQTKKLNYYHNGTYMPISYGYLMGDANYKNAVIDNMAISLMGSEAATAAGLKPSTIPATKSDSSIILTDYRGLVVLNEDYANAILAVCGNGVSCDGNGKGTPFNQTYIPEIIANFLGISKGSSEYENFMAVYNGGNIDSTIDGTKEDGTIVSGGFDTSSRTSTYKSLIDFYKPIFTAAASNGWTSEYASNLADNDYMSNAITSGIFQLATVNDIGGYEPGTSLQYYINAAFVTERRDSLEQEELTAWYNAEKAKISAKEDYWDVELQNLSTELSAINTEIEAVQSLIDDAVSSVFDWGG